MEYAPHDQHFSTGQRVLEEVAGMEAEPIREPVLLHITIEGLLEGRQIETTTRQVSVVLRDLNEETALGGTNIDDCLVIVPRELHGERPRHRQGLGRLGFGKTFERRLIGVPGGV